MTPKCSYVDDVTYVVQPGGRSAHTQTPCERTAQFRTRKGDEFLCKICYSRKLYCGQDVTEFYFPTEAEWAKLER